MALAAGLGLYRLTALSFWLDEASSVFAARLNWLQPLQAITASGDNTQHVISLYMPLYFALLSGWRILGESEFAIRSLSVIFAVAAVPVVFSVATRLYGTVAGVVAALLLSANGFFIDYAREARAYMLVVLFASLSTLLFLRAIEAPGRRRWLIYGVVTAIGLYAHLSVAAVPATHVVTMLAAPRLRARWRDAAIGYLAFAAVAAPLLLLVAAQSAPGLDWITRPAPGALADVWFSVAGHRTWQAAVYCVALLGVVALAVLGWRRRDAETWRLVLPIVGVVGPFVGLFAVSQVRPLWEDRYLVVVLPTLVLLPAALVDRLPAVLAGIRSSRPASSIVRWIAAAGVFAFVGLSAASDVTHAGQDVYREQWREATAYVLAGTQPGDAIAFFRPYVRMPYDYYVEQDVSTAPPDAIYPMSATGPFARQPTDDAAELVRVLESAAHRDRIWLVLAHDRNGERLPIVEAIEARYVLSASAHFEAVEVRLYQAR